MLNSTYSVLFQLFLLESTCALKGGWEQEQKDPGQRCHLSVLGADFLCYVSSNSAETSPIMEICGECLVGVLQVSFFFPLNYCDPTAKHYSVMYPLKLARGLPGKFNVFLWCLHGTSLNMNGKFFSTKGCSSSSTENLGKKIKDSSVPDFLIWGWDVNEAALRSSFSSSQSGVGRFIRKIPSQFPLSWLLQPEPGGSAALGEIYGSLKASNFAPCRGSEKDLRFWCFHRSCGWIQVFFDAPHTSERSSSCWFLFGSLGFFLFSFFHVDKAVFNVL